MSKHPHHSAVRSPKRATLSRHGALVGIDEAGRGPIAGPVAVGVFAVNHDGVLDIFRGVKDSKQLSARGREKWFALIEASVERGDAAYSVSFSSSGMIDARGIVPAIRSAMARSLSALSDIGFADNDSLVLLDGSLSAPAAYRRQETIIGGDAKESIIALASICAKVLRDRKMTALAEKYPQYGFDRHKGYGTEAHYEALRLHGACSEHRLTFL